MCVCVCVCVRVRACACTYACLCRYNKKTNSHLVIMKKMLVITLTRKRTPPVTARETARDTNNNSYDPKPENGNNSHFNTSQMFSRNQISSTDGGDVIKVNENKPVVFR